MEPITAQSVRAFLLKHDGKVKQTEFVSHFKEQLNDPNNKNKARQDFKDIVQRITAVKTENGEKYVILTNSHAAPSIRKQSRPINLRKDMAMSTPTFAHLQNVLGASRERINSIESLEGNHIEHSSLVGSNSTIASSTSDSGISMDSQSRSSIDSHSDNGRSRHNGMTSEGSETDLEDLDGLGMCDAVEFRTEEKEWMLAAASGDADKLAHLLKKYPDLASKRDFVLGYTALHWGAKRGKKSIILLIGDSHVDINMRTHGGYTALHLAALHGHNDVIKMLIDNYDADINARDFSGKKPKDVVKDTVQPNLQRRLGRSLILDPNIHLEGGVILRNDSWTTFDDSVLGTPEPMRRRDRAMSFLRKKKKPHLDLYEKAYDSDTAVRARSRPKSSVVISAPELQSRFDRVRAQSQSLIDV